MANTQFNSIIRLRRDNDYNYAKIKNTFIPANGEVCLVDTAREGLRAVCGDGVTPFGQLEFLNDFVKRGYFIEGTFYYDYELTQIIPKRLSCLYLDINSNQAYIYNGDNFIQISGVSANVELATEETAGIVKMYNSVGENTDGTMTQFAITKELDEKVELVLDEDNEMVIFEL